MTFLEGDLSLSVHLWRLKVYITSPIKLKYTLHYVDTKMTDFIFSSSLLLIKHETS